MKHNRQAGLTLIEMMIAMVIGLLITGVVIGLFVSNIKSTAENTKMTRLNQELRNVISFMSDDLKRHGFSASETNVYYEKLSVLPDQCIIYAYDTGDSLANDTFGFKLEDETIKWGQAVTSCNDGNWESLTDPNTARITRFDYERISTSASSVALVNQLVISITGEIDLNPGVARRTFAETIRIRNDEV